MRYVIAIALAILIASPSLAWYGVDPYTGKLERTDRDERLRHNPHTKQFEYAPEASSPRYNPIEKEWEMAPDDAVPQYNWQKRKYEYRKPGEPIKYDPLWEERERRE